MATILVVDDNHDVRGALARILEHFSYSVVEYEDAQPALEQVDFRGVDLVITDIRMPLPGDVFIRMLRERGIEVPVIVQSGCLSARKKDELKALGVQRIFEKPFLLVELILAVKKLLKDTTN